MFKSRRSRGSRCLRKFALLAAGVLLSVARVSWSQSAPARQAQPGQSLAESLARANRGETQLNILYVHGIGINPPSFKAPQDFQVSLEFRTNFCKQVSCTTPAGEFIGRNYADTDLFKSNARPTLQYLGSDVWKTNEDWNAAAPFVDHYKLVLMNGTTIYVHEINWWPLVLSAKCRQIIAPDASLVDLDKKHTAVCSAPTQADVDGRYKSYSWISANDIHARKPPWPRGATLNRWLKHDLLDWSFADALLAVGPLRQYLVEGIRETVLDSYKADQKQEFIIVSHSLGSYLMFSAVDFQDDSESPASAQAGASSMASEQQNVPQVSATEDWKKKFDDVLRGTSHAYFMANQLSLLELSNLEKSTNGSMITHLKAWGDLRAQIQQSAQIVAFSDPNDLLTWQVPNEGIDESSITVTNLPAINVRRWLWVFANPLSAHIDYDQNKAVIHAMIPKALGAQERRSAK